jgi:hypothetical protein
MQLFPTHQILPSHALGLQISNSLHSHPVFHASFCPIECMRGASSGQLCDRNNTLLLPIACTTCCDATYHAIAASHFVEQQTLSYMQKEKKYHHFLQHHRLKKNHRLAQKDHLHIWLWHVEGSRTPYFIPTVWRLAGRVPSNLSSQLLSCRTSDAVCSAIWRSAARQS